MVSSQGHDFIAGCIIAAKVPTFKLVLTATMCLATQLGLQSYNKENYHWESPASNTFNASRNFEGTKEHDGFATSYRLITMNIVKFFQKETRDRRNQASEESQLALEKL